MSRDLIIRRGESASHLLNNPTYLAALDEIETEAKEAWAKSNPADSQGREDAYRLYRCVTLIRDKLAAWRDGAQLEIANSKRVTMSV